MIAKPVLRSILSFDPGTANLGYSLLSCNPKTSEARITEHFGVFKTNKWDGEEEIPIRDRIDTLGTSVDLLIRSTNPSYIAMEDFVEQGKFVGKTYKEMAYLTEHLRLVCGRLGYDVMIYPNGIWKKKTLNAKNASKLQVQHYIRCKVLGVEALQKEPDHVWDSVGIGYCRWLDYLREISSFKNRGSVLRVK